MSDVEDIRNQMAAIRHDARYDVSNVVGDVGDVMSWRSVVRGHPYLTIGVALAAGYLLVPRRRRYTEQIKATQPLLGAAITPGSALDRPAKPPKSATRKAARWALGLLWPLVSRSVQAYASTWLEDQLKQHLSLNPRHPDPGDGNSASSAGKPGDAYGGDAVYRMPRRG